MMAFLVINLSCWINVIVKKLLVTFSNFGQVTLVIFWTCGQLKLFAEFELLFLAIYTNFGQVMHLLISQ